MTRAMPADLSERFAGRGAPPLFRPRFDGQSLPFQRRTEAVNALMRPYAVICGTGSWIEAHLISRLRQIQAIPNLIGCGIDANEVLDLCRRASDPALVMLSTSIAADHGLQLCTTLKQLPHPPKLCVFVDHLAANGFSTDLPCDAILLVTSFGSGVVQDALIAISQGQTYRDPALGALGAEPPVQLLKPREKQVLELLALGLTNKEIGAILNISAVTVRDYVQNLCRIFQALNRTDVVYRASCAGVLKTPVASA